MSELKPCPFCGKEPHEITLNGLPRVVCWGEVPDPDTWNIRPIEDALNTRIAELEGLIGKLIEIGNRLVFPDGVFDDEQSVIERDWRIAIKECEE